MLHLYKKVHSKKAGCKVAQTIWYNVKMGEMGGKEKRENAYLFLHKNKAYL